MFFAELSSLYYEERANSGIGLPAFLVFKFHESTSKLVNRINAVQVCDARNDAQGTER